MYDFDFIINMYTTRTRNVSEYMLVGLLALCLVLFCIAMREMEYIKINNIAG